MQTAKLFVNGRSQAVRLPKGFKFKGTDVFIQKVGNSVILFPKDRVLETFLSGLNRFTDDFMANGREQPEMQEHCTQNKRFDENQTAGSSGCN